MAPPKQTDPQFKLRMTPEIKERIEAAAAKNNRSMNAEILRRLEDSFDDEVLTERVRDSAFNRERQVLYVLLDADGMPTAWSEIMLHLDRLAEASGGDISRIDAVAIVPKDDRPEDAKVEAYLELARRYKKLGKGKSVGASLREAAPEVRHSSKTDNIGFRSSVFSPKAGFSFGPEDEDKKD